MGLRPEIKYLFFDVFGTVVDLSKSLTEGLQSAAATKLADSSATIPSDQRANATHLTTTQTWDTVTRLWRQSYHDYVRDWLAADYAAAGTTVYRTLDEVNPRLLSDVLAGQGLGALWSREEIQGLCHVWHELQPWADAQAGLHAMRQGGRFKVCTLSDGNEELLRDMAAKRGLQWDEVFGGSTFQAFKPSPRVYLGAARKVGVRPSECALVAAHLQDARAAWECGFGVVYVERRGEERVTDEEKERVRAAGWVDVWVREDEGAEGEKGLLEAAKRL